MTKEKLLLILAYYYPPYADVSGLRASKFAKYLSTTGWTPWVFTVHPSYYREKVSPVPGKNDEDVKIARIPALKIPGKVWLIKMLFPILALLFIIKNRKKINAVFITGSPFHPFLLTLPVTQCLRIPTVLDFRDSWSINHGFDGKKAIKRRQKLSEKALMAIERLAIKYASCVIFATSVLQNEYQQKFNSYSNKFHTITNGFDSDDIKFIAQTDTSNHNQLILAGKFYLYTPEAVESLMIALQNNPSINFVYIGNEHEVVKNVAEANNVFDRVKVFPYMTHRKVLEMIAASGVALMTNGMVNGLGTKIFEYLALGKPVICLVPKGSVLAQEFGGLPSVFISHPPHAPQKIDELLSTAFSVQASCTNVDISSYDRRVLTQKLAELLDTVC